MSDTTNQFMSLDDRALAIAARDARDALIGHVLSNDQESIDPVQGEVGSLRAVNAIHEACDALFACYARLKAKTK